MQKSLFKLYHFIKHQIIAKDEHAIHSPFIYELYNSVVVDLNPFYVFSSIEGIRKILIDSKQIVQVEDFGTGSCVNAKRKVSDIAQKSLKDARFGQILFKLVYFLKPQNIIELGTSLGITTLYLASPNKKSNVLTFEGARSIALLAQQNFKQLNLSNIRIVVGNINNTLSPELENLNFVDFAFIDANHSYEPTLNYFNIILKHSKPTTVIVVDDIYWSKEMNNAWNEIKNNPQVSASIDLYYLGIVFLNPQLTKQHYKLRY